VCCVDVLLPRVARPGMGGGSEEHETYGALWKGKGIGRGTCAAPGMCDKYCLPNFQLFERVGDYFRFAGG
jgi:hypothetical protein